MVGMHWYDLREQESIPNTHFKFYNGDESFLASPTQRTQDALTKFKQLLTKEREAGGVLSVDAETPSTITSHEPGYLLSKEEDVIVGFQGDEPLQRTCKPHGGYGVVKKALDAYGYTPGEKLQAFKDNVVTHNGKSALVLFCHMNLQAVDTNRSYYHLSWSS